MFNLIFSGKLIGKLSFGILTILLFSSYAIGIGHPQYLCLETPQSLSLKFIFFLPSFLSSSISIVLIIDSSGTFNPFKKSELKLFPDLYMLYWLFQSHHRNQLV